MKRLIVLGVGALAFSMSGVVGAFADAEKHAAVSVNVGLSCSMSVDGDSDTTLDSLISGTTNKDGRAMTVGCNSNGWGLQAVGANTNNANGAINTDMVSGDGMKIATGTSGSDSYWAMKVTVSGNATVADGFAGDGYHVIPGSVADLVKDATSGTTTVTPNYMVNISSLQAAGTYTGKVQYTLVNPGS